MAIDSIEKANTSNVDEYLLNRGLSEATIKAARLHAVETKNWPGVQGEGPVVCIPYYNTDGSPVTDLLGRPFERIRVAKPAPGEPKYCSRAGAGTAIYIPPTIRDTLIELDTLCITEGEFKALIACQHNIPAVAIQGCQCWHDSARHKAAREEAYKRFSMLPELDKDAPLHPMLIPLIRKKDGSARNIIIVGDADLAWKPEAADAKRAMEALADAIRWQFGAQVSLLFCPPILEAQYLKLTSCNHGEVQKAYEEADDGAKARIKEHKTGLDDWLQHTAKQDANGAGQHAQYVQRELLRHHTKHGHAYITAHYIPGATAEALDIAKEAMKRADHIYIVGKLPAAVENNADGSPSIRPLLNPEDYRIPLSKRIRFARGSKKGLVQIETPTPVLYALSNTSVHYERIRGITRVPIVNPQTGAVTAFKSGTHAGFVWDIPCLDEIQKAVAAFPDTTAAIRELLAPFIDFPFADPASRSALLALLLTLFARRQLPTAPMFIISSPEMGTGKTLLARLACLLILGTQPTQVAWPMSGGKTDDEELRKAMLTTLANKPDALLFDNIINGGYLDSSIIDAIITTSEYTGRLLGQNREITVQTDTTLICTGNNIAPDGDTRSRAYIIRLDAATADTTKRHFRYSEEQLYEMAKERRPRALAACIKIIQAYTEAGAPSARDMSIDNNRFSSWQRAARLPLIVAGLPDPDETISKTDTRKEVDGEVLAAIYEVMNNAPWTAGELTALAESKPELKTYLMYVAGRGTQLKQQAVGYWCTRVLDRIIGDFVLRCVGIDSHKKVRKYAVERVNKELATRSIFEDEFFAETDDVETKASAPMLALAPPKAETPKPKGKAKARSVGNVTEATPETAIQTSTPEPQPNTPAPFLTTLTDEHRALLQQTPWLSFDLETTALTRASAPVILTTQTKIGNTPWKKYKDIHNASADTTARARILSCTVQYIDSTQTLAWDLDRLSEAEKTELFALCIEGKILIGHNLTFDLSWATWYTNAKPAQVLDTMLLIRALWPSLPLMLHEKTEADEVTEKYINTSKPGGIAGIGLEAVALALDLNMPQGKAYQRPENWVPSALTMEHYEYAVSDTTVVLDILGHILGHFGIKDVGIDKAWEALEAKNPGGWIAYRDAFAPAIPLLADMHRLGLPLDGEGLKTLLEMKDKEAHAHAEELIKIIPELGPFLDDLVHGGLTNRIKQAIAAHIERQGIRLNVENQSKLTETGDVSLKKASADKPKVENQSKATSISEDTLKKISADKLPFYPTWLQLRESLKIRQMLESLQKLAGVDGRLHSLISIAADTGRTTSQEPNLQNFPRDPAFRKLVRARPGFVLVDADLGAIEMRIAAALAERAIKEFCLGGPRQKDLPRWLLDANVVPSHDWQRKMKAKFYACVKKLKAIDYHSRLAEVFRSGVDPHTATGLSLMRAAGVLPEGMPEDIIGWLANMKPEERATMKKQVGDWRQKAKALNFGLLYGQSAKGLYYYGITSYGLSWSQEEAEKAREVWLDTYPEIVFWQLVTEFASSRQALLIAKDKQSGKIERKYRRIFTAETLSGRPLTTLTVQSILNYQDQGTGAEMLLIAMARLPDDLRQYMVDIVHDEILLEVPADMAPRAQVALEEAMVSAAEAMLQPWGVSAEADAASGETWADAKT